MGSRSNHTHTYPKRVRGNILKILKEIKIEIEGQVRREERWKRERQVREEREEYAKNIKGIYVDVVQKVI